MPKKYTDKLTKEEIRRLGIVFKNRGTMLFEDLDYEMEFKALSKEWKNTTDNKKLLELDIKLLALLGNEHNSFIYDRTRAIIRHMEHVYLSLRPSNGDGFKLQASVDKHLSGCSKDDCKGNLDCVDEEPQ